MTVPAASIVEALSQGAMPPVGTGASAPATPFAAVIATLLGGASEAGLPAAILAPGLAPGEADGAGALPAGLAFGHALPPGAPGAAGEDGEHGVLGLLGQPADTAVPGALPSPGAAAGGGIDPFDPAAVLPPFAPASGKAGTSAPAAPASQGAASRAPFAPMEPGGVASPGTPASPLVAQTPDGSNVASAATAPRAVDAGQHAAPPAPPVPADEIALSRGTAPAPTPPVRVRFDAAPPAPPTAPPRPSARLSGEAALATTAAAGPNPSSTAPGAAVARGAAAMADGGEITPLPNNPARSAADDAIPPSTGAHPELTRGEPNAAADTSHSATQPHILGEARFGAPNTAPQHPVQATTGGAPASAPNPVPPHEVTEQVALQLRGSLRNGADRITIQLKPAALGTIDIKLDVAHDGRVTAVIAADRSDTLDLLQRDARGIERALHDAGLRTDSGSLSFNLRGEGRHDALVHADTGADAGPHPDDAGAGEPDGAEGGRASATDHVLDIEV